MTKMSTTQRNAILRQLDLDNLTPGLHFPANTEIGSPAGVVVAVEYRPCGDHDTETGDGTGWLRICGRCEVVWTTEFDGIDEQRRAALANKYLWTGPDREARAAYENKHLAEWDEQQRNAEPFDPWSIT
jgi:hypothetical protein